ncbi:MAG: tetraacyldisaccharide 4'-kinase [Gammaproteobacteria bacterium]|nr:tetraacyldisaccharide 4'-kinase [Gammaproteobacteria bacterium]MCW9005774.1 tetraacyldisaccharide 4'-kinase [Gammaproteobacteria bacterium]
MKRLDEYWYNQNPVAWILWPLSLIFCLIVSLRKFFYQINLFKKPAISVPVIIVGNISVGGTGKTPLLISLCKHLQALGFRPGIISRGYGGQAASWPQIVTSDSQPLLVGDEPVLISRRTDCPVVVGPDRVSDIEQLLARDNCNIILSDDGLQHYRLDRDLEIAVIDAARLTGNGFCLPAGPLREPLRRLKTVDMVVYNGGNSQALTFSLEHDQLLSVSNDNESLLLESLRDKSVHAIAGIGHPERFFNLLTSYGLDIIKHRFPDHYSYTIEDLSFNDELPILMTEKDAVKCKSFNIANSWYLPVSAILSEATKNKFNQLIKQVKNG